MSTGICILGKKATQRRRARGIGISRTRFRPALMAALLFAGGPRIAQGVTFTQLDGIGTYAVPEDITAVHVTAIGGAGQDGDVSNVNGGSTIVPGGVGGRGSKVVATVPVTPGAILNANAATEGILGSFGGYGEPFDGQDGGSGGVGGNASWVALINQGPGDPY